jgi:phospholipid-binding lipoprotein MlaA
MRAVALATALALTLAAAAAEPVAPATAPAAPAVEPATLPAEPATIANVNDPWEGWNRAIFKFNYRFDKKVVRPFARGYRDHVAAPVRDGVSRFLDNLENPLNLFNNLLQGKPLRAGSDLLRFAINTTLGIGGFLDPATKLGLKQSDEDFGQTLGKWGVGTGPYLLLPFLPPKTVRELVGEVPDQRLDPFTYVDDELVRYGGKTFDYFELRYRVLGIDDLVDEAYDPYVFVRNAYLERRAYKVRDGVPVPVETGEDDLYDDPDATDEPPASEPPPLDPTLPPDSVPAEPPPY